MCCSGAVAVSMKSGEGLSNLLGQLEERAAGLMDGGAQRPAYSASASDRLIRVCDALTRAAATHESELFVGSSVRRSCVGSGYWEG